MKLWEDKRVGKPKGHFGQPNQFLLLYKIRKCREEKGFFPSKTGGDIVRRTISFCNKDFSLHVGERYVKFPNANKWMAER